MVGKRKNSAVGEGDNNSDVRKSLFGPFYQHVTIVVLAACITSLFALVAIFVKPLNPVKRAVEEFSFTDVYYEILKESKLPDTCRFITIVDMTELTDRSEIAHLLSEVEKHQPKVVGFDVCFDVEGEDLVGNDSLIRVAEKYKNIVFALKMVDWVGGNTGWSKAIHSFFYEITDITEGTINMPRTLYDSMKRRVPLCERYNGKNHPSLVAQLANIYAGYDVVKGRTDDININFTPTYFRVISHKDVSAHPEFIHDRIVLVGAMYEDADSHWTPIGKIAGIELLAYGLQSVIYMNEIKTVPFWILCIISLLIILFVEVLQHLYLEIMAKSRYIFVQHIIGSYYMMNLFTFMFTAVIIGVSFMVFKVYNLSFNLGWAFSVITFLSTSRSLYKAIRAYFISRSEKRKKEKDNE